MSVSATFRNSGTIGGISFNSTVTRSDDAGITVNPTLPAAKSGTLSTRTDDNTGTLTLGASHGVTDGQIIDVYWSGGRRYGMTVGTVSGTSVPIDGGTGDNLPAQATAITAQVQQAVDFDVTGNDISALALLCANRAHIVFDAGTDVHVDLVAGELYRWFENGEFTNPLAGATVTQILATHDGTASVELKAAVLYTTG